MRFELRHFNEKLLVFEYEKNALKGESCHIVFITDRAHLLPFGLEPTSRGLLNWIKTRVIPKNREFVETILSKTGLSINDPISIIRISKGLSLNDCYWIVEEGFSGRFEEYNLYENNFSRVLALIAYTGYGSGAIRRFTSSPEFTTNGMLKKCWRRINGEIFLYKGGTSGAANAGLEPYSEFYASQIAEAMGIKHVSYGLSKWKGTFSSTCKAFTSLNESFVPMWRVFKSDSLIELANMLKGMGKGIYDDFVDMLVFDAVIFNTDRHLGNFGFLIDSKTNEISGFAPVFDNGLSLFNYAIEDEIENLKEYSRTRKPAMGISFEENVSLFISERQRRKLRKLFNFKFKMHPRYNLPKKRIKAIERFLELRVRELLNLKR